MRTWSTVVLSVLLWACTEPSRLQLHVPADPPPQVLTQECGELRMQLTLVRTRQSALVADVFITTAANQMLSDISRVVIAFTRQTQAHTTTTLIARLRETGHYVPINDFLLTTDPWIVEITVRRVNESAVNCRFSFDV